MISDLVQQRRFQEAIDLLISKAHGGSNNENEVEYVLNTLLEYDLSANHMSHAFESLCLLLHPVFFQNETKLKDLWHMYLTLFQERKILLSFLRNHDLPSFLSVSTVNQVLFHVLNENETSLLHRLLVTKRQMKDLRNDIDRT